MARLRRGASPTTARLCGVSRGPTLTTVTTCPSGTSLSSPWLRASFQVFDLAIGEQVDGGIAAPARLGAEQLQEGREQVGARGGRLLRLDFLQDALGVGVESAEHLFGTSADADERHLVGGSQSLDDGERGVLGAGESGDAAGLGVHAGGAVEQQDDLATAGSFALPKSRSQCFTTGRQTMKMKKSRNSVRSMAMQRLEELHARRCWT